MKKTRPSKPGPKALPANVHRFRGTWREDRHADKETPAPPKPKGRATIPPGLSAEAAREWRRLAPHLHRLRLLTPVDRGAMLLLCEWYAIAMFASKKVRSGPRPTGDRSRPGAHPVAGAARPTSTVG